LGRNGVVIVLVALLIVAGCGEKKETTLQLGEARSTGNFAAFEALPGWSDAAAQDGVKALLKQCRVKPLAALHTACAAATHATDARGFFETYFRPFMLSDKAQSEGLMTGYYEPLLHGSMTRSERYLYPLYTAPSDLLHIELSTLYPDLKHRYLRGRLEGNRVVPYPSRAQINAGDINASALCYVSSDIDRFFLQVQGSGRVLVEGNETMFVGHSDRNGHPYRSIGKLMIEEGLIPKEQISLQSIRAYLRAHPEAKRRILESNPSFIFFGRRSQGATGTLGVELTPMHSVAVDRTRIPLGYPLYFAATDPLSASPVHEVAMAQDTGSAIKGQVRADLFFGYGEPAEARAGRMKSPLRLWLLVPKD